MSIYSMVHTTGNSHPGGAKGRLVQGFKRLHAAAGNQRGQPAHRQRNGKARKQFFSTVFSFHHPP